ncbi:hypothetical protein FWF74_03550 [Candidatus Saccharibacteria bacterium]|nr:hypothetical protein [Candidatus Saccharibacteria bacterium]MCL1962849.1 hypothetical protein [Candidatus Saccharibacteria bacterium]
MLTESGYFTLDGKCSDERPKNEASYCSEERHCFGCQYHLRIGGCALGKYMLRTVHDEHRTLFSDYFDDNGSLCDDVGGYRDGEILTMILKQGTFFENPSVENCIALLKCKRALNYTPGSLTDKNVHFMGFEGSSMKTKEDLDRAWKTPGSALHDIRVEEALACAEKHREWSEENGFGWSPATSESELVPWHFFTRDEDEGMLDDEGFEIDKDKPDPEILKEEWRFRDSYSDGGWYVGTDGARSHFRRRVLSYYVDKYMCDGCKYYNKPEHACEIGRMMLEDAAEGDHEINSGFDKGREFEDSMIYATVYDNEAPVDKWGDKKVLSRLACGYRCDSRPDGADGSYVKEYRGPDGSGVETLQKLNAAWRIPDVMSKEWHNAQLDEASLRVTRAIESAERLTNMLAEELAALGEEGEEDKGEEDTGEEQITLTQMGQVLMDYLQTLKDDPDWKEKIIAKRAELQKKLSNGGNEKTTEDPNKPKVCEGCARYRGGDGVDSCATASMIYGDIDRRERDQLLAYFAPRIDGEEEECQFKVLPEEGV